VLIAFPSESYVAFVAVVAVAALPDILFDNTPVAAVTIPELFTYTG
jgi:hypothetical protein